MDQRILILEDERNQVKLYEKYLKAVGYRLFFASNGVEGIEQLKTVKPDMIILDLVMPKMGGVEFYHNICGVDGSPQCPVLVVTSHTELTGMVNKLDIKGLLVKPFETSNLLTKIQTILDKELVKKKSEYTKRLLIIDEEELFSQLIYNLFSEMGYECEIIKSGNLGVEEILRNPPDLAMVSLGLSDLPGDSLILKLQQVVKTRKTKYLLYVHDNQRHDKVIIEKFAEKTGVKFMCEYKRPIDFFQAVTKMLFEE